MIKYNSRMTPITREEFVSIITNNPKTICVGYGSNPTSGIETDSWVDLVFHKADVATEGQPWVNGEDGIEFHRLGYRTLLKLRIVENPFETRRFYFKNEEHKVLIRVAYNDGISDASCNGNAVRVAVLKYSF